MFRNYAKSCLKRKKLLEILEVVKTLAVNLWESPREKGGGGGGVRLLNKALFGEASPQVQSLTLIYTILTKGIPFVYLALKSCTLFIYLLRENKSVRKEVFRQGSY